MSGPQPPPYPGPTGPQQPGQQPPPYPGPATPPPYPGPPAPPPHYPGPPGSPPPYPGPPAGQPPYPGPPPGGPPPYGYHPYPARPRKPKPDTAARVIGWILAVSAVAVMVAAFLPWVSAGTGSNAQTFHGVGAEDIPGAPGLEGEVFIGYLTIFLAAIVLGFAITRGCGALPLTAAIIGVVLGALILLCGVAGLSDDPVTFTDRTTGVEIDEYGSGVDWKVGAGVWFTIAAAGAMIVASIVGLVKRR